MKQNNKIKSLWDDKEAAEYQGDLALRVYTSRLLGRDKTLVLHGGGNTSVKIRQKNIFGDDEDVLYVKGSGWDLETIEEPGFPPVQLPYLIKLAELPALNDIQMVNELRTHMLLASAPTPSVEAILHAIIPYKYVDHTHANAAVSITNTKEGPQRIKEIYGDDMVVIPYVMPGFDLARICAEKFKSEANENTIGMVLMNHGVFSFADDAKTSYERMIELISRAEDYLEKKQAWAMVWERAKPAAYEAKQSLRLEIAELRKKASEVAGFPMLLATETDGRCMAFIGRNDIGRISQQGPATPDHVIRTKRLPLLGRDMDAYVKGYQAYFDKHAPNAKDKKTILDACPRVILDKELGMCALGRSVKETSIISDIYHHTMDIIERSEMLGGFQALPAQDIFDVEYWDLEQAKLRKSGSPPVFSGEIALVTGAASGIGKACVDSLLARGTVVIALDVNPDIENVNDAAGYLGMVCDVTDEGQLIAAIETGVKAFGGLDILVLNAGMFPPAGRIDSMDSDVWRKVMSVNLDANLVLMREAYPLLKLAPAGGRVVVIGSRNVPAPGPGAAAYSASKAAVNQLARVAALEWSGDNIRINTVNPDAVFDTAIWTDEVLEDRAKHYGMTVDEYKRKNLLKTEITSHDVAEMVAEMCGPLFAKTTGAQLPIDGGNDRVI